MNETFYNFLNFSFKKTYIINIIIKCKIKNKLIKWMSQKVKFGALLKHMKIIMMY